MVRPRVVDGADGLQRWRVKLKVNDKVVPVVFLTKHHAIKTYRGVDIYLHLFSDLGTRWKWVVSFTPRPLYRQGKSLCYPFDGRLGVPQNLSGCGGEEKISLPLPGFDPPLLQPIAANTCIE